MSPHGPPRQSAPLRGCRAVQPEGSRCLTEGGDQGVREDTGDTARSRQFSLTRSSADGGGSTGGRGEPRGRGRSPGRPPAATAGPAAPTDPVRRAPARPPAAGPARRGAGHSAAAPRAPGWAPTRSSTAGAGTGTGTETPPEGAAAARPRGTPLCSHPAGTTTGLAGRAEGASPTSPGRRRPDDGRG